jgi:hypothetical protein
VDELVGTAEIAARLRAARARVVNEWLRRYPGGFPEPLVRLPAGMIWACSDVEAWARRTGTLS